MLESLYKKGSPVPKLDHPMFDGWIEKLEEEDYWEMARLLREFTSSKSSFIAGESNFSIASAGNLCEQRVAREHLPRTACAATARAESRCVVC
jgi:hypothetical protein